MNFRELRACTKRTIRGRYRRVLRESLRYPAAWLFFRLVPDVLAGLLIAKGCFTPKELLFGGIPLWTAYSVLWEVLRFIILLPLQCRTCGWFTDLTELGEERTFFTGTDALLRAAWYFLRVELCRLAAVLPLALGLLGAEYAFHEAEDAADGGFALFLTAQCLCLAAVGAVRYVRFCIGLAAVPYLFAADPNGSPFADIQRSCRVLRGHHAELLRLVLGYLPAALPVVTIPFLLPYLVTDYTLFIQICIREEEEHAHTAIYHEAHRAVQA